MFVQPCAKRILRTEEDRVGRVCVYFRTPILDFAHTAAAAAAAAPLEALLARWPYKAS